MGLNTLKDVGILNVVGLNGGSDVGLNMGFY